MVQPRIHKKNSSLIKILKIFPSNIYTNAEYFLSSDKFKQAEIVSNNMFFSICFIWEVRVLVKLKFNHKTITQHMQFFKRLIFSSQETHQYKFVFTRLVYIYPKYIYIYISAKDTTGSKVSRHQNVSFCFLKNPPRTICCLYPKCIFQPTSTRTRK